MEKKTYSDCLICKQQRIYPMQSAYMQCAYMQSFVEAHFLFPPRRVMGGRGRERLNIDPGTSVAESEPILFGRRRLQGTVFGSSFFLQVINKCLNFYDSFF